MNLTKERREELKALGEKATKGPWTTDKYERPDWEPGRRGGSVRLGRRYDADDLLCVDSAFIAASREALPAALADIDELEAKLAGIRAAALRYSACPLDSSDNPESWSRLDALLKSC